MRRNRLMQFLFQLFVPLSYTDIITNISIQKLESTCWISFIGICPLQLAVLILTHVSQGFQVQDPISLHIMTVKRTINEVIGCGQLGLPLTGCLMGENNGNKEVQAHLYSMKLETGECKRNDWEGNRKFQKSLSNGIVSLVG